MIKAIKVTNYIGESLTMELKHPERSGFIVANIDGLGPAKANINMTELATDDGGTFTSSRLDARNIVMRLGFDETHNIEEMRLKTYKYFPIKRRLKLTIYTDKRTAEIYGYVETNEPEIFSSQSFTQISIICPDPYFYSLEKGVTVFSGVEDLLEFPLENPSLTEDLIEVSALHVNKEQTVLYKGDVEIGVQINIKAFGPVENLTIINVNTGQQMNISHDRLVALTGLGIINKDEIIITTDRSNKSITLLREGVYYNILNTLDRETDWFTLNSGDNVFVYVADEGGTNLQFRITNRIAYEGV